MCINRKVSEIVEAVSQELLEIPPEIDSDDGGIVVKAYACVTCKHQ